MPAAPCAQEPAHTADVTLRGLTAADFSRTARLAENGAGGGVHFSASSANSSNDLAVTP
jgi:hypothetical protein